MGRQRKNKADVTEIRYIHSPWLRRWDLNHTTSGLWARRATNCSTPRYYGAGDRGRTGTLLSQHWILSPRRLPVPPHRLGKRNAQPFFIAYLLYHFPHALSTPFCSFLFIFCTTFFDFAFIFKNVTKPQPRRFAVFRTLRRPKWYN